MRPSIAGRSNQIRILNRFLIENVAVGDHCQGGFPDLVLLPEVSLGATLQEDTGGNSRGVAAEKSAHATTDHVRR
jgi:hypothetical protein